MLNNLIIKFPKSIIKMDLLFIATFLLIINSGFYIQHYFLICPIYLSFYLAFLVILHIIIKNKKIKIPISGLFCLITIFYQFFSQLLLDVRIWSVLSSVCTILFYIITIILLSRLCYCKVLFISDAFLIYNFLLYLADTIYRFNAFNFNIINIFLNFYEMKENCFIFDDTNSLAINTTILAFFSYYLFKLTQNNKYKILMVLFFILTFFTFSRAAILAIFISMVIFYSYGHYKNVYNFARFSITKIPFSKFFSYIWLIGILLLSIPIGVIIILFLMSDASFLTKIDIFNDIAIFFQKATISQILFGIGLDHAESFVGMYAHNYIATYLMETGIVGYTLITSFFLRILYESPRTIYILLPFSILGISFIGYSILNLFYVVLALIVFLDHNQKIKVSYEQKV